MITLIDCTLRDGGYYTNWDFEKNTIKKYFKYINQLPIEYIEIGYRNNLKKGYFGEFHYLSTKTIKTITNLTNKKLSIMLDGKNCTLETIDDLLIDLDTERFLIRIATSLENFESTFLIAKKIKKMGFKVAMNIMYLSKIVNDETFYSKIKELKIENTLSFLYLVDSYGSILPDDLKILLKKIQKNSTIKLGFHGHNNLEMAFINTLTANQNGVEYIDSTILGMGRGAGNLKTELILTYLKSINEKDTDLNSLGKLIEFFLPLKKQYNWGTNLAYIVSGSYSLPQKDVMEALEINRYSLTGIVDSLYDQKNTNTLEIKVLVPDENLTSCIIIGGGKSIEKHISAIKYFLKQNSEILIIHSTSKYLKKFENLKNKQYFVIAGDELTKLDKIHKYISKYILEPNFKRVNKDLFNQTLFYKLSEISFINKYNDSPLTISLQTALDLNIKNIYSVGFDGYTHLKKKKDFYLMQENQTIFNEFKARKIISLTETKYNNIIQHSIYTKI